VAQVFFIGFGGLKVIDCQHLKYKQGQYCTSDNALNGMRLGKVAWMGMVIKKCEDCGKDLSEYRIVPYKTPEQYIAELKIAKPHTKRRGKYG
jgi:hypothetical protein